MTQWTEVQDLAQYFKQIQEVTNVNNLSENNCIEIIDKLLKQNLIELIYTTDGKEYLTPKHLLKEIRQELISAGGRINIVDLAGLLRIDLSHIENAINELLKLDSNLKYLLGQLITKQYDQSICEDITNILSQKGICSTTELARRFDLPGEYILTVIKQNLGKHIKDAVFNADSKNLYTENYVLGQQALLRGLLRACLYPITLEYAVTQYHADENLIMNLVEKLVQNKECDGFLQHSANLSSARSTRDKLALVKFVPTIFALLQQQTIQEMYENQKYISYSALQKLYVTSDYKSTIKKALSTTMDNIKFPPPIFFEKCCVHPDIIKTLVSDFTHCLTTYGFCDLENLLPPYLDVELDWPAIFQEYIVCGEGSIFNSTNINNENAMIVDTKRKFIWLDDSDLFWSSTNISGILNSEKNVPSLLNNTKNGCFDSSSIIIGKLSEKGDTFLTDLDSGFIISQLLVRKYGQLFVGTLKERALKQLETQSEQNNNPKLYFSPDNNKVENVSFDYLDDNKSKRREERRRFQQKRSQHINEETDENQSINVANQSSNSQRTVGGGGGRGAREIRTKAVKQHQNQKSRAHEKNLLTNQKAEHQEREKTLVKSAHDYEERVKALEQNSIIPLDEMRRQLENFASHLTMSEIGEDFSTIFTDENRREQFEILVCYLLLEPLQSEYERELNQCRAEFVNISRSSQRDTCDKTAEICNLEFQKLQTFHKNLQSYHTLLNDKLYTDLEKYLVKSDVIELYCHLVEYMANFQSQNISEENSEQHREQLFKLAQTTEGRKKMVAEFSESSRNVFATLSKLISQNNVSGFCEELLLLSQSNSLHMVLKKVDKRMERQINQEYRQQLIARLDALLNRLNSETKSESSDENKKTSIQNNNVSINETILSAFHHLVLLLFSQAFTTNNTNILNLKASGKFVPQLISTLCSSTAQDTHVTEVDGTKDRDKKKRQSKKGAKNDEFFENSESKTAETKKSDHTATSLTARNLEMLKECQTEILEMVRRVGGDNQKPNSIISSDHGDDITLENINTGNNNISSGLHNVEEVQNIVQKLFELKKLISL